MAELTLDLNTEVIETPEDAQPELTNAFQKLMKDLQAKGLTPAQIQASFFVAADNVFGFEF